MREVIEQATGAALRIPGKGTNSGDLGPSRGLVGDCKSARSQWTVSLVTPHCRLLRRCARRTRRFVMRAGVSGTHGTCGMSGSTRMHGSPRGNGNPVLGGRSTLSPMRCAGGGTPGSPKWQQEDAKARAAGGTLNKVRDL